MNKRKTGAVYEQKAAEYLEKAGCRILEMNYRCRAGEIDIVARDGRYVGTVSEGDFLWHILDRENNSLRTQEKLPLRRVLRANFNPAVRIDVTLSQLLERSMHQSFIPVVDDRGAFVGIVTRQNIIRHLTIPKMEEPVQEEILPSAVLSAPRAHS